MKYGIFLKTNQTKERRVKVNVMYRNGEKELVNLSRFYRFIVLNAEVEGFEIEDVGYEVIGYVNENSRYDDRYTFYASKSKKKCIEVLDGIEEALGDYYGKS